MKPPKGSALYAGHVWHKRRKPKAHSFKYSVFYVLLDLDDFEQEKASLPFLLSLDRFNLFSVYQKDYGLKKVGLKAHIQETVKKLVPHETPAKIMMLTMPRLFGYGFNPISIYYCYNSGGGLMALLYEVHNTFGERHTYACHVDASETTIEPHGTDKKFHVSPFFDTEGSYLFRNKLEGEDLSLAIRYRGPNLEHRLTAILALKRKKFSSSNLLSLFVRIPFVTLKVIAGIHYEAFWIWVKGAPFFKKPAAPDSLYTFRNTKARKGNS